MVGISERDVVAAIGPADELVMTELLRTKASPLELRRALHFVLSPHGGDANAYQTLKLRMRRLVDLLSVSVGPTAAAGSARQAPEYHEENYRAA